MTNFEKFMPFLIAFLLLGTGAVIYFTLRMERRLAARKKINLANYREKNNLFYVFRDIPVMVFALALALGSGFVAFLCIKTSSVLTIYVLPLVLLVLVNGVAVYFSVSRPKYSRDIRVFDAYYVQVADLLANKERTERNIDECKRRVTDLRTRLNQTIEGFNKNLTQTVSGEFVTPLFLPVVKMVNDYTAELKRFSEEIEKDFNEALSQFLHHNTEPQLHVVPLKAFDNATVDELLASIKSSYGARIATQVMEQIESGAVASATALGNVMELLHSMNVEIDKDTTIRFVRSAARFDDRAELCALLYKNKQIPLAMVQEVIIPEAWDWCFGAGMSEAFNQRELIAILTDVLAADRGVMCYQLLSQFDASHCPVLEEALRRQTASTEGAPANGATQLAMAYRMVLSNDYAVSGTAGIFENLALMLFDRRKSLGLTPEEQGTIEEIVRSGKFLQGRREIGGLYKKASAFGKPLVDSTTRIFLQYLMTAPTMENAFLSPKRLVSVLGEYRFTLSFDDLAVLRTLVASLLMMCSDDVNVRNMVIAELYALPACVPLPEGVTAEIAPEVGKRLLGYLLKNELTRLRSALYRTEADRLGLDVVVTLVKGGEDNG